MKKNYFLKYLLILIVSITSSSLFGQITMSDQELIIKECLTLKPLQDKIPDDVKESMGEYYILNKGVKLRTSHGFETDGKSISLIDVSEIDSSKPYFVFNTLNTENDRALVEYTFIFKNNGIEKSMTITVEFGKNNSEWKQYNYYIAN